MSYSLLAIVGVAAAAALDLAVLRTKLLLRKAFWLSYAIIVCFQLIVNGLLTGMAVVRYDRHRIIGARIAYAPVEDLLFGFAMVTVTLSMWVWLGRRVPSQPHGAPAERRAAP